MPNLLLAAHNAGQGKRQRDEVVEFEKNLAQMEELVRRGYEVLPILSYNAGELDTRFMTAPAGAAGVHYRP